MSIFLNNQTTIRNKCSNFVHKIKYKGMAGKRYSKIFTSGKRYDILRMQKVRWTDKVLFAP